MGKANEYSSNNCIPSVSTFLTNTSTVLSLTVNRMLVHRDQGTRAAGLRTGVGHDGSRSQARIISPRAMWYVWYLIDISIRFTTNITNISYSMADVRDIVRSHWHRLTARSYHADSRSNRIFCDSYTSFGMSFAARLIQPACMHHIYYT